MARSEARQKSPVRRSAILVFPRTLNALTEAIHPRRKVTVHSTKHFFHIASLGLCMLCLGAVAALASGNPFVSVNDVTWTTLGRNEND